MDEELDFVQPHKKIKVNLVPCEDAIRREAAIDAMYHHFCDKSREECAQILHEVPSVNPQANKEDIHREREQAYMRGYEDGSRKYRIEPCEDAISRTAVRDLICRNNDKYGYSDRFHEFTEKCLNLPPVTVKEKTDLYKQGWHDAIGKALDEAYDIVIDGERFSVVQEETLIGVGMAYEQVSTEKTGRWEWVQYDGNPNIGNWHCSECRKIIPHMPENTDNTPIYKWCPYCGAKMGVEE